MGTKMNRTFYVIPYGKLINKLKHKFSQLGSEVLINEESYTSKCDALAFEKIKKQKQYKGIRISRGLYKSSTGLTINADLNGAINIMRKCFDELRKRKTNKRDVNMENIIGLSICNPEKKHI